MREQQGRPRNHKKNQDLRGVKPLLRGLGGYTRRVRARAPNGTKYKRERLVPLQKIRQNLQASAYTPFEAQGLLSGTIIRSTSNTPKHGWKTSSKQTVKAGKHSSKLKPHLPRDAISSRPSPTSGKNSSPGRIHASPEGLHRQWAHPRLARGQARANFVVQQPRPNRLTTDRIACAFNAGGHRMCNWYYLHPSSSIQINLSFTYEHVDKLLIFHPTRSVLGIKKGMG
jgi:hypothetical protein